EAGFEQPTPTRASDDSGTVAGSAFLSRSSRLAGGVCTRSPEENCGFHRARGLPIEHLAAARRPTLPAGAFRAMAAGLAAGDRNDRSTAARNASATAAIHPGVPAFAPTLGKRAGSSHGVR